MREILFRGKRTDNGEWVYGYYTNARYYLNEKEMHIIFEPDVEVFPHCEFAGYEEVIPETVGQYTGLTDRNGKKIFEGDIVKMRAYGVGYHCTSVYFRDGKFAVDGTQYHFKNICSNSVEVIGNIYDNPELLEVKQNG